MKISVLIGSRDRIDVLVRCLNSVLSQKYSPLEVVVLDDNSSQYCLQELLAAKITDPRLRCIRSDTMLGVARGRNLLMQQAGGDVFVVIDDDAYFADDQALCRLADVLHSQPGAGIVACKIIDHRAGQKRLLLPFSQRTRKQHPAITEQFGRASYFLGGGHAVRRQVINSCGLYSSELTFGEEELDLSYRAIEAGFQIYYLPTVIIHHYPQPSVVRAGKLKQPELYFHVRNRFFLAYKYLPWKYVPFYLLIWLIRYSREGLQKKALRECRRGIRAGFNLWRRIDRTPLSPRAVTYLQKNHGRLWY